MSTEFRMPKLTQTMSSATVVRWLKKEGEALASGEPFLMVETDKAAVEVESPITGVLGSILLAEGEAPVGTTIAILLKPGEQPSDRGPVATAAVPGMATASPVTPSKPLQASGRGNRVRISPLAKRLAEGKGIELTLLTPTGPGGLVTEADVHRYLESAATRLEQQPAPIPKTQPDAIPVAVSPAPAPASLASRPAEEDEEYIPLIGVRKTIAERLSLSKRTAADVTTVAEVDMSEIAALREHLDFSYTAFVARATALALTEFPILNSRLEGDRIVVGKRVHLGVAVAIDDGLRVPVIRDAHTKGLRQIASELAEKAQRASAGKLTPEELTGSSFTLTNSGVFGSLMFTPIINPPESAILGMGKVAKTPIVRDDQIVIGRIMHLCLTYDHRVIDGAPAVRFLQRVKSLLEKPALMI